ncbi:MULTISPECIES: APC family permease [unclassified Acinetobacter]|uniref:APC family permease n=1 Tax=unclassified Acinetobacter TaxID=196816 RepID=UPI00293428B7|nr:MULTISPECIES: APC family permease [unclassified Acinetobacter]WOE31535.1 APC family permease [Acinetobacter sp. SAAs470]WOE39731.1 APC family permease [Acinetobacter sp. SAAs474]
MEKSESSSKKLSLWQVTIIGIAYMTPMTVFDTFGIVSDLTSGHVPFAYLLALSAMLLTALSYARFSRHSEKSGSAYSYTAQSLGAKSGFFVGWCSLLDYLLLPLINVLLAAIYLHALIPSVPYWLWVIVSSGLVTLVNCFRIKLLANLSLVFVFAPIILMLVFIYLVIDGIGSSQGYQHVLSLKPLWHGPQELLPLIAGASVLCFSFLGFDAVTTLSHETRNPTKTIPRAVILTTLAGGVIFFTASWFIQLYFPSNIRFQNPSEALPEIVLYVGGALFQSIFLCGQIMNTVASGLASHASASRLLYIMGQDNIFPKKYFGTIHASLNTPFFSVLFVGLVSLSAMFLNLAQVVSLISFGALVAFTAVNFSVFVKFYLRDQQRNGLKNKFFNLFLPLFSMITIMALWINLDSSSLIFGCFWLLAGISLFIYKMLKKQTIAISNAY